MPFVDDIEFKPENSRRAIERSSNSESTLNSETSRQSIGRSSSSISAFNPESSESLDGYATARESLSDLGGVSFILAQGSSLTDTFIRYPVVAYGMNMDAQCILSS